MLSHKRQTRPSQQRPGPRSFVRRPKGGGGKEVFSISTSGKLAVYATPLGKHGLCCWQCDLSQFWKHTRWIFWTYHSWHHRQTHLLIWLVHFLHWLLMTEISVSKLNFIPTDRRLGASQCTGVLMIKKMLCHYFKGTISVNGSTGRSHW